MAEPLTCANHPNVRTGLRCSKCEKPICTSCIVETPVGLRCRQCAQLRRIPTFDVSPLQYLQAIGTAAGLGLVMGFAWPFFTALLPFGFLLSFLIVLAVGYVMGEVVSLSVNRKGGTGLKIIAAGGVFLAYLVSRMPLLALLGAPSLAIFGATRALLDPFGLLAVAVAIYLAVSRIR